MHRAHGILWKMTKKKHSSPPKRHVVRTLFIGLTLIGALLVFALVHNAQVEYSNAIIRDDVKFARLESFIDLVQQRLRAELPDGNWEIYKFCTQAHQKASNPDKSCEYGVRGMTQDVDKMHATVRPFAKSQWMQVSEDDKAYYFDSVIPALCYMSIATTGEPKNAQVGCSLEAATLRYTLLDE